MKILVTGARGYIGKYLTRYLFDEGYEVRKWDIKDGFDIFDSKLESQIKMADVVVHLAAKTSVEESFTKVGEYCYVNIGGICKVAALCAKYKKKLIFPSSAAVHFVDSSPYARTKQISEWVIKTFEKEFPWVIMRIFNVYSEDPKSGSVFYRFMHENPIIVNGKGNQIRDFIHIKDVCRIIMKAIGNDKFNWKTFDVGTGRGIFIDQLAHMFSTYCGKKIEYGEKKQEVISSVANTEFLREIYKFPLEMDLVKTIKDLKI